MSNDADRRFKFALSLSPDPLDGITQNEQYWILGQVQIAKTHATFRVGYGASLTRDSRFFTRSFDVDGRKGIAILFQGSKNGTEFLAGWVPPERDREASDWANTLNGEIKRVVDADDNYEKGVYDEAKAEFERTKHNKPSDLVARAKPKSPK